MDKPEDEPWLMENFEKKRLSWSGILVTSKEEREKLREEGMRGRLANPTEAAWSWILLYADTGTYAYTAPYNIYLVVAQPRIPAFGQVGEYLVEMPDKSLVIYSEKKFKRDLKLV